MEIKSNNTIHATHKTSFELFPYAANWYALYLSIVKGWPPDEAIEYMLGDKRESPFGKQNNFKDIKNNVRER